MILANMICRSRYLVVMEEKIIPNPTAISAKRTMSTGKRTICQWIVSSVPVAAY